MTDKTKSWHSDRGFSIIELIIVMAVIAIITTFALPQLISSRRLLRSSAISRELVTQLRFARQLAMSQRRAITFQYNNTNKRIVIIQHNLVYPGPDGIVGGANAADDTRVGISVLNDVNYPLTNTRVTVRTVLLAASGVSVADIIYGKPAGASTAALDDGTNMPDPAPNRLNITFQPDGSVINGLGNIVDNAIFLHNNQAPAATAAAVSVLGAAGRVKRWRYNPNASPGTYIE